MTSVLTITNLRILISFCRRSLAIFAASLCFLAFTSCLVHAQTQSFESLSDSVYQLNNQLRYKESQTLLLPILQSQERSNEERYQACLLLSYTYKRLQDYESNLQFLSKARQFAKQSGQGKQYLAQITAEEAFSYFDIRRYEKSDSLMRALEATGFKFLDLENRAKLTMQQGYLLFLDKRYNQAEETYDRAIGWLRQSSICDLPMIYVKKMQLYDAMQRPGQMHGAFWEARNSADSCGIIKYDIYAHEEFLRILETHNDPAAVPISRRLDSLNKVYEQTANIAALHNQKEAIMAASRDQEIQVEQAYRRYLTLGLWAAGLLVLLLVGWGIHYYRKKRGVEADFRRIQSELEAYLVQQKQVPPTTNGSAQNLEAKSPGLPNPHFKHLSERQNEVLGLMEAGLGNREIAERIFISENTVKYHIRNIYQILDIKDRKDLFVNLRK